VLDQVMPGMTGVEIADRLRGQGFDRPIVLCSAYLGPELDADIDRLDLIPVNKIDVQALVRTAGAAVAGAGHRMPR
jgi:CheY-like chemotaxis protein